MDALSSVTGAASKYMLSPIGTALHFVAVKQFEGRLVRHAANVGRALYLANLILGFAGMLKAVHTTMEDNKMKMRTDTKDSVVQDIVIGTLVSLVPGGGLVLANAEFEWELPLLPTQIELPD